MHDVWSPRAVPIILLDPHFTIMCNPVTRDCYPGYEIDTFYCLTCKYDRYTHIYIYTRLSRAKHNLLFDFVTAYRVFVCSSRFTFVFMEYENSMGNTDFYPSPFNGSPLLLFFFLNSLFTFALSAWSCYANGKNGNVRTFISKNLISFNFDSNLKS